MAADYPDPYEAELTPREREVLALARRGLSNNEIATELGISRNAVRFHLKDIHSKLETGSRRNVLVRAFERGFGLLALPAAKLGVPLTTALFSGAIGVTAFAAYQAFPGDRADAAPERFEGVVLVDGKFPNGCPDEYRAGTMTLEDFAHGRTTIEALRALNPNLPLGPLPPDTVVKVPYDPTSACGEAQATPPGGASTLPATSAIIATWPSNGGSVSQASTRSPDPSKPDGVCAIVSFADTPEYGQWFRMSLDGEDVTGRLTWVVPSTLATGRMCLVSADGLEPGRHQASVSVRDPKEDRFTPVLHSTSWTFEVTP